MVVAKPIQYADKDWVIFKNQVSLRDIEACKNISEMSSILVQCSFSITFIDFRFIMLTEALMKELDHDLDPCSYSLQLQAVLQTTAVKVHRNR